MKTLLIFLVCLCFLPLFAASAQEPAVTCDYITLLDSVNAAVADSRAAFESGDATGALALMADAEARLVEAQVTCRPEVTITEGEPILSYSSEEQGLQAVITGVELPRGAYRVEATTDGFMSMEYEVVSGETCEGNSPGASLFNIFQGRASRGAQVLFVSSECELILQISNTREPWTLTFTPITGDQMLTDLEFSSEISGLQPVIGVVDIPSGRYLATATTDGIMSLSVLPWEGTCDTGSFGTSLFNLFSDQANDGAEALFTSEDCKALIIVSNTGEPWTLTLERLD